VPASGVKTGAQAVEDAARRLSIWVQDRTAGLLRARRVSLDICLTSNHALGIATDLSEHPVQALLDAGIACTLGADDPLLFGTDEWLAGPTTSDSQVDRLDPGSARTCPFRLGRAPCAPARGTRHGWDCKKVGVTPEP
jgi:hypothetical protein